MKYLLSLIILTANIMIISAKYIILAALIVIIASINAIFIPSNINDECFEDDKPIDFLIYKKDPHEITQDFTIICK